MSRTNELRKLIQSKLKEIHENVYFQEADDDNIYPHIVFDFKRIDLGDLNRKDYVAEIDVWSKDVKEAEDLADRIEDEFGNKNVPQETILPTFFLIDRNTVPDDDKSIKHRLIRVQVQMYER